MQTQQTSEPYGYLYLTTNMINGKNYIGQKKASKIIPSYKGSGRSLKKAFKKYGKDAFKTVVVRWYYSKEALDNAEEQATINHNAVKSELFYNLCDGGNTSSGFITPLETRKKQSLSRLEYYSKNPPKTGVDLHNFGISRSEETKDKISKAMKEYYSVHEHHSKGENHPNYGKKLKDSTKEKISEATKGRVYKKVQCPHCDKVGGLNSMKRYHFDNCKNN